MPKNETTISQRRERRFIMGSMLGLLCGFSLADSCAADAMLPPLSRDQAADINKKALAQQAFSAKLDAKDQESGV